VGNGFSMGLNDRCHRGSLVLASIRLNSCMGHFHTRLQSKTLSFNHPRTLLMYQNFIGIDIGKLNFFVGTTENNETSSFENNAKGFTSLFTKYREKLKTALVILETTGGYEKALISYLLKKNIAVHRADTHKVKYFIRSLGVLGKSDAIDALGLAKYGKERHAQLALYQPLSDAQNELSQWIHRRQELKKMLVQEKNRQQSPNQKNLRKSFSPIIDALNQEIANVDKKIETFIQGDKEFKEKTKILCTIAGIGKIIAAELVGLLPELGHINRRQIASLSGLAPHPYESGKKIGYRSTRGGRQELRPILFMAAMSASRSKDKLGSYYQHLLKVGKKKMVALTALMRKIIVIANARIKEFLIQKNIFIQHS
jgi:transposase